MFGYVFCLQNYNRVCRNLYSLWEFLYPVLHLWHPGSNSKACCCRSLATFSSQTFLRKIFSPHWQRSDCFKSLAVTNNAAGYLAFLRSNMPQIHLLAALAEILQETTVVSREVQTPWNEKVSYGERLSNKMVQASGKTLFSVSVTRQEYSCAKLRICRHKDSHWRRYSTQGCEPWAGTERSERSVDVEWNACKAALLKNLQGQILATHESCNRCRRALLSHEPRCKFLAIVFGVGFSCLHHQARSTLWKS